MPTVKVEVNCDDIFDEGECYNENCERGGTLTKLLTDSIVYETVNKLREQVSEITRKAITDEAISKVSEKVEVIVDVKTSEITAEYTIKSGYGSGKTLSDYISEQIERRLNKHDFSRMIDKVCTSYINTIQERYDKLFAAQLIDQMLKANLLKDDRIAELLIERKKEGGE